MSKRTYENIAAYRFGTSAIITDAWVETANLGDVDDIEAAIFLCKKYEYPVIYVNNDVPGRYDMYVVRYGDFLRRINPNVQFISNSTPNLAGILNGVENIFILARIHSEDDENLYNFMTTTDLSSKKIYAQGVPLALTKEQIETYGCNPALTKNQPVGYNFQVVGGKTKIAYSLTETPFVFGFGPGDTNRVTCYPSDATNRRMTTAQLRRLVSDSSIVDIIIEFSLRKLAFPPPFPGNFVAAAPVRPFGIGLYVERFGTGNNSKGLLFANGQLIPGQVVDVNGFINSFKTDDDINAYCADHPGTGAYLALYEPWLSIPGNEAERKAFRHAIVYVSETADRYIDVLQPGGIEVAPSFDNTPKALGATNIRFKNLDSVQYVSPWFDLGTMLAVAMRLTPVDLFNKGNFNGVPEKEFCDYLCECL